MTNQELPPVYKDFRGEIKKYEVDGIKFNVLTTKEGMLRSGDFHPNTQYDLILKGEVEIILRQDDKDVIIKKGPNELIKIQPNIPHLFKALTDTVMIEWWDGLFEAKYYEPYRKLIKEQFEKNKST